MLRTLKEIYYLLTADQRKKLLRLQILVALMAFAEIAGVVSIGPFMALVGDMSQLQEEGLFAQVYQASGASSPDQFLFWLGVSVLVLLTCAALVSMYTIYQLSMYGERVGAELSNRLFHYYMRQSWLFHASGSSSHLTKQIAVECSRVTGGIVNPLMLMNAKLVMAAFMAVTIFFYNPLVATTGLLIFSSAYFGLYRTVRHRLKANGKITSQTQHRRFKLMHEGFGGIKDALLLGRQQLFTERFDAASLKFARAQGVSKAISQVPRYAMELVAFSSIIFLVLYLLTSHRGNIGTILPILSVYALAGFKLLPALQQVYNSVSVIRANLAAFEALRDDLYLSEAPPLDSAVRPENVLNDVLRPSESIHLADVSFTYPGKEEPAVRGLNLVIPANSVIGLVGSSGSGKSTTIDLLLGLIKPDRGQVLIDGEPLTSNNLRAWQNSLGFVPQAIFLADSSIRENIAFGLPSTAIDEERIRHAIKMAHLEELIKELPNGLETCVGERGVQLSGGQRQRIGIARALYYDADVLVLDEATSALDGITEKLIMDAIHDFSGSKTIIMIAHRLATVKQCDCIYLMAEGRIVDEGSYQALVNRNTIFKRMVEHS